MTRPPRVFDTSAILALFGAGHQYFADLLVMANAGRLTIVLPTLAVGEANTIVQQPPAAWESILLISNVQCVSFTQHIAIEVGAWVGSLVTRHVVYEAGAVRGIIVTRTPEEYRGHRVSLRVLD